MKIEIQLANKTDCSDCPILGYDKLENNICGLGYPVPDTLYPDDDISVGFVERPEICKTENGD